jgi:mRNA-degrading endonuclease YafQ of YafQ-DinJ toxin-antitoxin module
VAEIDIPSAFKRTALKKEPRMQAAIARCVALLTDNPRHPGLHTHRVQGTRDVWEAYIDNANRITFHYDEDGRIIFRKNCNHSILRRP